MWNLSQWKLSGQATVRQNSLASLLLCFLSLASGCGYQLQQALQFSEVIQPIYVEGELQLATELRRALKRQKIAVTHSRSQAKSTVTLSNVTSETRNYSLSSDGRNAELLLIAQATVQWQRRPQADIADATLINSSDIRAESTLLQNPNQLDAQQQESTLVGKEMRAVLVDKILILMRYHQSPELRSSTN